ncbi:MAG TPA: MFS transporter [Ktedonobacterales bacterium]|jgi:MFS family permease
MSRRIRWLANPYGALFRSRPFARFWTGFTISALGDAMTRVALVWFVYQATKSPEAVGILLLCYTGPVLIGGLLAGYLLDRFDRGRVMLVDNLIRGLAVGLIPLLYALGALALWQLYVVAGIYGFLYMITLAGTPSLIPSLANEEQLSAANALETLSYTVTGVLGPPIAGLLIAWVGAPGVLLLDAASYAVFVVALAGMPQLAPQSSSAVGQRPLDAPIRAYRLRDAVRLMLSNRVLLSTTVMFILFNVGFGFLAVWLPVFAASLPGDGATLYGVLLGALALGEMVGATLAGGFTGSRGLGILICLAQLLSGLSLALLLVGQALGWPLAGALAGLTLLGVFSAPLTIWAQTLRMQIIPEPLRGRTFALLRTLMQGAGPLASAVAGFALPLIGATSVLGAAAALIGVPGLVGTQVRELRIAPKASNAAAIGMD